MRAYFVSVETCVGRVNFPVLCSAGEAWQTAAGRELARRGLSLADDVRLSRKGRAAWNAVRISQGEYLSLVA